MFKFELGARVTDTVLGMGPLAVTARVEYISGHRSYCVEYQTTTGAHETRWFNEERLMPADS